MQVFNYFVHGTKFQKAGDGTPLKHCPQLGGPDIPQDRGDLHNTDYFQVQKGSVPAADFAEPALFAGAGTKRQVSREDSPAFQPERERQLLNQD